MELGFDIWPTFFPFDESPPDNHDHDLDGVDDSESPPASPDLWEEADPFDAIPMDQWPRSDDPIEPWTEGDEFTTSPDRLSENGSNHYDPMDIDTEPL
jgi:hypothetical protein